ncbi:condensation domain-containing protein [Dactylosporangium sp. CA-233914]|uniref:condensation domain-containing protein n=1 Tax=Dactylosporangium sp. CA-233914 TaxID=3239934 RepID=UPI003D8A8D78
MAAVSGLPQQRLRAGTDLPIGTAVAGRTEETFDLVGCFVNTLVLRTDTAGDPTFAELLDRVRAVDLAVYDHQDLPFDQVVQDVNPPRAGNRNPLFQVGLSLTDRPGQLLDLPGLTAAVEFTDTDTSRCDLWFVGNERRDAAGAPAGIHGYFEYSADLFEEETVRRFGRILCDLLRSVAQDPHRRIGPVEPM